MGAVTTALAIGAAASMMQASQQSDALNQQADYSERMSRINKRLSDMQADDAVERGNTQARNVEKQGKQVLDRSVRTSQLKGSRLILARLKTSRPKRPR